MAPILDWKNLIKVDPDALPRQEELADSLLETISRIDGKRLKSETREQVIHLFKITQSLMKMKAQEVELALEEVEKAGEEQARCENQFKTEVMKLQNELEKAQRSAGGQDTVFLHDEICQLEKQLEQKERQLTDKEKELEKERKVNEQLALRNEDAENENIRLRREKKHMKKKNEQLRQDLADYQKQTYSQKETVLIRRGEESDYRSQLLKKNFELAQYFDDIQNLTEANEKLDIQNQEMRKNLEESVQEMEKMTDEYNKMKRIVQQSDFVMDQLRKEKEHYKLQIQELSDQLKAKNEEDDPLMAAVNEKVEEWKKILAAKDDELLEYQKTLFNLEEKLKMAQLDVDRNSIVALQQIISELYVGVQERDAQIRLLTEQVEQYTKEMEQNAFIIEELKNDLKKDKGHSSHQNQIGDIQEKLKILEERTKEAEKSAELAEADAREKDKELAETLKRMRRYELGVYGLEEAVVEIKDLKKQIKIRDHEIETLVKEINKLELKINDFLDENEELRERLGLEPKTMIDLNEFRSSKALKQQQFRAEKQILLQEIERLEEERIELKKQVRKFAQEKGRFATIGLDANEADSFTDEKEINMRKLDFLKRHDIAEVKAKASNSCNVEGRNTIADREAPVRLLKSEKDIAENSKAVGNLPRSTSGIFENLNLLETNRNASSVHLGSKHVTEWQLSSDNCNSEALSIQELYVSSELQFTQTSGIKDYADKREMSKDLKSDYRDVFPPYQLVCQTSEVNNCNDRKKPSFQNQLSIASNSDLRDQENFCPGLSLRENTMISSASALEKLVRHKTRMTPLNIKHDDSQIKFSDLTAFQEDREGRKCQTGLLQGKSLGSGLENRQTEHSGQVDPVENLIEQLRRELAFLRSQNEQISRDLFIKSMINSCTELNLERYRSQAVQNEYLTNELSMKEKDLERNEAAIVKFQAKLRELSEENKQLEQGMRDILQAVKEMQKDPCAKGGETALIIPSLDRLVNAIESKNSDGIFDANVHLKAQVDQLTGRNEELRQELKQTQKEATNLSNQLASANEKIAQLQNEICVLRQSEGANIVFQTVNLPEGIAPSGVNMINSLNEYLIHLIQELENKEKLLKQLEDAVEDYKRKFAVIRHQQGLLYKEYQSQKESWQKESESIKEEKKKLEEQKEQDATKIKAYSNLLSALQLDPDETKKVLAENNRKITVLRVNERSLTRQYTTLLETERHLRKENEKLKDEITQMETTVIGKIGDLQRFKEMASFKIAALQKVLDGSVPLSELELANKQYNALTAKYRDMLQKDNLLVQRTTNMEHMEHENESLKAQINLLNKELEITKEKLHTVEQAWEQMTKLGDDNAMDKATKAITNSEILSISKKITMLEMKELNERQRAEHSQRMYEHLRNTVKEIEQRNFELEAKFAELTKINLEAQKVEQELREELSKSVSKAVSDADRRQIMDLEKREMELKIEVSKLRELSDVAKTQVEALRARQQCRDKEVESLRMQILDYQAQSDEKAVIAKLHQHIMALQGSESVAVGKLETLKLKLQKVEIQNLRLEQKLDEKEQALYFARLEGRNRAKHLQQTVQSLRQQFSGALPLAQQEKFSKTMIQLQNDKLKILEEVQHAQQERRNAENRALEMELKLKSLEELISALKDTRGAQKVIEWHMKMQELHLQELKLNRELVKQKEEVKYMRNMITEYECTISNLEEEVVQQRKFHEERQIAWDQREVELQRQLDLYDRQQNEKLSTAPKLEEATGSAPDPSLPLPQQLEFALRKNQEHVQTILETRATCKSLEEKLKEREAALWEAEQNVLSRDRVINELRLQLPATSEREKIMAEIGKQEDDREHHHAIKIAHQTITNMQARLNQKEEVLKKYQHLLAKAREEQEEIAKKHEEDLRVLHQKLSLHTDKSLNKFKETALELMKKTSLPLSNNNYFLRIAEMEQTVAEQDNSLASLVEKLKKTSSELEKQKEITLMKIKEFEAVRTQLQEKHTTDKEQLKEEANELRNMLSQMEKELANVKTELEVQKEANNRAPTATLKNLVEQLKSQLAIKEKQQKALSKALLELRAEMTANAEQQIIAAASQKEAYMNVQEIVDRETRGLNAEIEELNNQITKLTDNLKISKTRESSLSDERDELNQELQKKQKAFAKMLREKNELEKENEELKKRIRRLSNSIQSKVDEQNLIDALQKKIKKLESELEKKCEETEKKGVREVKTSKEEIIRWEEGKKGQIRMEGLRNKLREKEKEADALAKQLSTLKEAYTRTEKEKISLQKKLKTTGVTVDHVVGLRALEIEKELEELRKRNLELENEVAHMRTQQAIPRDSVVEELHFKNQYLQEKLHALQRQDSRETYSRPLSTCDQTELTKSVPISISKQKYLNYLQKKSISSRNEIKHKSNYSITDGNEIDGEADVQACTMHKEGHEAPAVGSTEVAHEQHSEDAEKCKDADVSRDGLEKQNSAEADEENCSEKEENITQAENGKFNEEFEEEKRKQEIVKQSNIDQEESVEEPCTNRMSCNQSDSGEPSDQANYDEAEKINANNEMNQHTEEDKHKSGTEGVETSPEFCEMPETSGIGSDEQYQREQEILKENLRLSSENIELRFQLEQANKDLPRLKDQVGDLKEMCELLKKDKAALERKLGTIGEAGRSGKTVPELEKTIGLMKKVVERVQRENEDLKKARAAVSNEKLLEQENEKLKSEMEKMKLHLEGQMSLRYESKTKGMEKLITENARLHKELKKEADSREKLRIAKSNLEILNEKLTVQLEETIKRLNLAESQLDRADTKRWKSLVETRLTNNRLEKEKQQLAHQVEDYKHHILTNTSEGPSAGHNEIVEKDKNDKLIAEVADLQTQLKATELENQLLKEETKKLRKGLENFDPSIFEEIEDLKYNYNEEVKKNIILEDRLKQLSEEYGIQVDSPGSVPVD
ncbi:centrosomal protein of 290 kDa isoform X1 [Heliangelus exortis]|uniref:centrosomal protein of 290 kDa isoform X1 n=1 Tax=Heliangelus exortis TaxID=472823 RepID=UPI003A9581D7